MAARAGGGRAQVFLQVDARSAPSFPFQAPGLLLMTPKTPLVLGLGLRV